MHSTHNEGKSWKIYWNIENTSYKHMNAISKNVYIDKLDDKVNRYNNAYPSTIKIKLVDVKLSTYWL